MLYDKEDRIKSSINFTLIISIFFSTLITTIFTQHKLILKKELLIVFCITTFLCTIFLIISFKKKGYIDVTEELKVVGDRKKRYCTKCKINKPERAHHCRRCNRCIKRMDHHCPWIGTCVNNDNFAHFIRFLFFSCVSSTISSFLFISLIYAFFRNNPIKNNLIFSFFICFHFLLTTLISVFTFLFFIFNLNLLLKNLTFIEKNILEDMSAMGMIIKKNPYDLGKLKNLIVLLGKPYFLFLFGENIGNGINFRKTYSIEEWPPVRLPFMYNYEIDL
ncbi:DHHC zinc finger domain-containing protein [Tubulinosema ratisbonensis]|uniref:Palmitoyltransferase n=1 Tax=Tubulinosema ratisbonensis TaxID=291195 RepID=A0A437AR16_9MICR|nr:DHHC zinc finger domain-containing protein [Tubulinosema ratisbonensis]